MASVLEELSGYLSTLGFNNHSVGTAFHSGEVDFQTTMPTEWQARYFQNQYMAADPLPAAALHYRDPIRWSAISKMFPKSLVMNEARDFGLREGMAFAHKGFVVSASFDHKVSDADLRYICDGSIKLINEAHARSARLTSKQKGVLVLMASGYSNEQMAEICGVSDNAIKSTKSRIFRALDVSTTAQAIGMLKHLTGDD